VATKRLPSLDGVRALSIGLVLVGHTVPYSARHLTGDLANLGVRCFFVLSGFLITTLLLQEFEDSGSISLRNFYARRTLRIFPASYAFLLIIFVLEKLSVVPDVSASSWIHALTYTTDYAHTGTLDWTLGHLWSLAVEEQFYLIWPLAIALLRPRKALLAAAMVVLFVPLVRWTTWRFFPEHAEAIKWQFHTVCDALATGCLLAGVRGAIGSTPIYRRLLRPPALGIVALGILTVNWLSVGRPQFSNLLGQTVMNLGIAFCIDYVLRKPDGSVGRVLNLGAIAYVGTLSYSMYLWQQIFFLNPKWTHTILTIPLSVTGTLVAAWLSYTLIERPFLSMRGRFAPSRGRSPKEIPVSFSNP
jgi:peptidoglycan/LPS O-acetylase OafA/YrhL